MEIIPRTYLFDDEQFPSGFDRAVKNGGFLAKYSHSSY